MDNKRCFIKELIIENFMSYKYTRIPFSPGLNLIIGPNGAGKSSILLALSVGLGQTYTERSRKLGELIRWGEEYGRVTIRIDNSPRNGKRPIPYINKDEIIITRILRRDGQYIFQINHRNVAKTEIQMMLKSVGLNPDNPLIIMHQNMVETFGFVDSKTKLALFEEAVGLKEYRERILDSRQKLDKAVKDEIEVKKLLDETEGVLIQYKREYEKLLKKRELIKKREQLIKELYWSKYFRLKDDYDKISNQIRGLREELEDVIRERDSYRIKAAAVDKQLNALYIKIRDLLEEATHVAYEMGRGVLNESTLVKLRRSIEHSMKLLKNKYNEYVQYRINEGILNYKAVYLESEIKQLESQIGKLDRELARAYTDAKALSDEIHTRRKQTEIIAEIREVDALLKIYKDIDESIEDTYKYYRGVYTDLKKKLEEAKSNRIKAEEELNKRIQVWRKNLMNIISVVSNEYSKLLNGIGAEGYARIININDINNAGLELIVAFRGGEEKVLDAYTQSGGERTTAIVLFLLALQRFIKSPLRAIDEFDIHMDPRNREVIMSHLINMMRGRGEQYIVITPGYVTGELKDINVIVVQKTGEFSTVYPLGETVDVEEK